MERLIQMFEEIIDIRDSLGKRHCLTHIIVMSVCEMEYQLQQHLEILSVCYAILEELSKTHNYPIKKYQNCAMYFIPNSRLDEIYCDYPKENGKTCREQGAILSYNKRLQEESAYTEYRKTYQQKFGIVNKNKDDKKLKKEFETWKIYYFKSDRYSNNRY